MEQDYADMVKDEEDQTEDSVEEDVNIDKWFPVDRHLDNL